MSSSLIVSTIFLEVLAAVFGAFTFFFVLREYRRNHQLHLAFLAVSLAAFSTLFFLTYLAQLFYIFGTIGQDGVSFRVINLAFVLDVTFMFLAVVAAFTRSRRQWVWYVVIGLGALFLVTAALVRHVGIIRLNGLPFGSYGPADLLILATAVIVVYLGLIGFPATNLIRNRIKGAQQERSDLILILSGIFGLLFVTLFVSAMLTRDLLPLFVCYLVVLAKQLVMVPGLVAKRHPDKLVVRQPVRTLIGRSLQLKTVGLNVLVFGALAFLLVTVTSSIFASSSIDSEESQIARTMRLTAQEHGSNALELEERAEWFASALSVPDPSSDMDETDALSDKCASLNFFGRNLAIHVFDTEGTLVYTNQRSSLKSTEIDIRARSHVARVALSGETHSSTEEAITLHQDTVLRAAAPIKDASGTIGGIVILDQSAFLGFFEQLQPLPSIVAGGGYIKDSGATYLTYGSELPRSVLEKLIDLPQDDYVTGWSDGFKYYLRPNYSSDRTVDGYFYAFATEDSISREYVRIMSLVTLLSLLATLLMMSLLVYVNRWVLRPVALLSSATRKMDGGDYGATVRYESADELGQLARSFNHMAATVRDRTRELNQALQEQRDYLFNTAHEMRTPLNIFRWTLEMMRFGDAGELNEEQLELLEQMHQTNERLYTLVNNLLDSAKIEQGRVALKKEAFPIESVIDETAANLAVLARKKNVRLVWEGPAKELPPVSGDADRLKQILVNLLSNSVKYTQEGGRVQVSAKRVGTSGPERRDRGEFIRVDVADTGRGIPEKEQKRVFSRFFRSKEVVKDDISGTGLGLFITKKLVDLHGGEIWFVSAAGHGTTFSFTIPTHKEK
ncbi:hypothetical protein AMJ57_01285 [Parcubacteria bacterium SG8_24]|nr:MAG: hypothetical protein AMJ57_01285 [Parcubacteria bacterium SG8_24]